MKIISNKENTPKSEQGKVPRCEQYTKDSSRECSSPQRNEWELHAEKRQEIRDTDMRSQEAGTPAFPQINLEEREEGQIRKTKRKFPHTPSTLKHTLVYSPELHHQVTPPTQIMGLLGGSVGNMLVMEA